jgi:hypothetical protein
MQKIKKREIKALVVQVASETWRIPVHTDEGVRIVKQMVNSITGYNAGFFLEERVEYET